MSSPCVLPLSPASPARMLKRPRSPSSSPPPAASPAKILKPSPAAPAVAVPTAAVAEPAALPAALLDAPVLLACANIRAAIQFVQSARRHALALCVQNQWERALAVLEKVERANDHISRHRRRVVLERANGPPSPIAKAAEVAKVAEVAKAGRRGVRFAEEVEVAEAQAMDRSPAPMPLLLRDEILVLRASRPIPAQNFSEFW